MNPAPPVTRMFNECVRSKFGRRPPSQGTDAGVIAADKAKSRSYVRRFRPQTQPFADETVSLAAPHRVCPEGNRYGPPVGEGRFPALCVPGIQGGLFLDSGVSRLKMISIPNCGVVSNVGSSPPFTQFTQIHTQSVGGLVSTPKVPHAIVSSAVHRPHICRRHATNATPSSRRAAEP
jgi:hypothetical protein